MNYSSLTSSEPCFAQLVECLNTGDRQAIEKIWKIFGPDLQRRARTRLRQYGLVGHAESMDICNAVLLDLVRQERLEIRDPGDLIKYIRVAIDNQVRDEYKLLTRDRRDVRRNESLPVEDHSIPGSKTSPSQAMIRSEIFERVVRQLGDEGQKILNMVIQDYSWDAIGKQVGATADAVRMKWTRAVNNVRAQLFSESGGWS